MAVAAVGKRKNGRDGFGVNGGWCSTVSTAGLETKGTTARRMAQHLPVMAKCLETCCGNWTGQYKTMMISDPCK